MNNVGIDEAGSAVPLINVSIIIPTHNRSQLLQNTLIAIKRQNYPAANLKVWVVDDESTDDTAGVVKAIQGNMPVTYVWQTNSGPSAARNNGAARADGDVLVFVDDDVELGPDTILHLVRGIASMDRAVLVGTLLAFEQLESTGGIEHSGGSLNDELISIPAGKCFSGLLAVRRRDFDELEKFQDPQGGWPYWDDIDFGYRASISGFALRRSQLARAIHHDTSAASLAAATHRWYCAGRSAVRLFQKNPGLRAQLPMFADKTPIRWGQDNSRTIVRKLARRAVSSSMVQAVLKWVDNVSFVQNLFPGLAQSVRRWILGAYVFHGIRQGIKDFGDFPE